MSELGRLASALAHLDVQQGFWSLLKEVPEGERASFQSKFDGYEKWSYISGASNLNETWLHNRLDFKFSNNELSGVLRYSINVWFKPEKIKISASLELVDQDDLSDMVLEDLFPRTAGGIAEFKTLMEKCLLSVSQSMRRIIFNSDPTVLASQARKAPTAHFFTDDQGEQP